MVNRAREQDPDLTIRWSEDRGVAAVLIGQICEWKKGESPNKLLASFLREYGPLFGPRDILKNHELVGVEKRKGGHVRIRAMQKVGGVPIYGATLLLFADRKRGVFRVQSGMYREVEVPPPKLGAREVDFSVRAESLAGRLRKRLEADPAGKKLLRTRKGEVGLEAHDDGGPEFPLTAPPKLWLYPTKNGLRQAFQVSAYQPVEWQDAAGRSSKAVAEADMVIDARTGRIIKEDAGLGMAYTDTTGDGLSALEDDTGTRFTRLLLVVQEDGADHLLINRTRTPDIITHDAEGDEASLVTMFENNTHVSRDANGHWDQTTTSCTAAHREASQQPEADGHFFADEAWQFYDSLGWQGFDDGGWGTHCPVRIATHIGMKANAAFWRYVDAGGKHWGYLKFYDGSCSSSNLAFDFLAGDPVIFAHEYQHAITYFGARDTAGNPGYLDTSGWHRAIHEGLSDAMAGLRTGIWVTPGLWRAGVTRNAQPFRRIEFPRSTDTNGGDFYLDHYDDRNTNNGDYNRSTILSHAAYLAGQGGVHQRTARAAELIPVTGAGRQNIAAIFHYAVTEYFDTVSANATGGDTMIDAARLILDAAEAVTGTTRSCEYVLLRRAFYAVGLYPFDDDYVAEEYGGEACMLPWTYDWRHSRPYLGFAPHWWRSPDLFVNNGNGAEYDAIVDQENDLFARVRNIGDADLNHVKVRFYYRAHGTNLPSGSAQWKECRDQAGAACVLDIPQLAAGSMNFTDPNTPPASQAVKWYLNPAEIVGGLGHFCLRALIECAGPNHDHDCPNHVQSNVSYSETEWGQTFEFSFLVANRGRQPIPLQLDVEHTLPKGIDPTFKGRVHPDRMRLSPRQERKIAMTVKLPRRPPTLLPPPFDGEIAATVVGHDLREEFHGTLSDARLVKKGGAPPRDPALAYIEGMISGRIGKRRRINGRFAGTLDRKTGSLRGTLRGDIYGGRQRTLPRAKLNLKGVLAPARVINVTQLAAGEPVGGVTLQLKIPRLHHQIALAESRKEKP